MGSFLQNVGRAVKKGVVDTGHAIGNAQNNKWVKGAEAAGLAATGVGAPAAALLMGGAGLVGGAIRSGGGLKGAITGAGQGALTGAAAGIGGSLIRGGAGLVKQGLTTVGSKLLPGGGQPTDAGGAASPSEEDQFYNSIPGTTGYSGPTEGVGMGSGDNPLMRVGKGIAGALMPRNKDGSIDYGKLLQAGVGAGTAYEGYKANQDATNLRKQALDAATSQYNANAPLRAQATAGLQNTQRPDLSGMFDDQNPYKKRSLMTVGSRSPVGGY